MSVYLEQYTYKSIDDDFSFLDKYPVSTQHRFDIHATSITLKQRCTDVKTTSCAYWVKDQFQSYQ